MKYRLMVSEDCGCSYFCLDENEDIEALRNVAEGLDWQRWYIETEKGEFTNDICPIHAGILERLKQINT